MIEDDILIDSNVLIYAFDKDENEKNPIARAILKRIFNGEMNAFLSTQNLSEFYYNVTKKIKKPLEVTEAKEIISDLVSLSNIKIVKIDENTIINAIEISMKYNIHYWDALIASVMKEKLLDMCSKNHLWLKYYDFPMAHRTSNALDRLMKFMSRHIYNHQYFHGSTAAATLNMRAYALIYNFVPSCAHTIKKHDGMRSPAERINGFRYHENWLQNLLISASLGGHRKNHSKTG